MFSSKANQCISITSGNWSNGSTWSCGVKPDCGDTIIISAGDIVTISQQEDYTACLEPMFLTIEGTLDFSNGKKLDLPTGSGIIVEAGGAITGGGGGSANVISIDGVSAWTSSSGDVTDPIVIGTPVITDIMSIASGNWSNVATWDCACIPDSLNNVTVDTLHSVVLDVNGTSSNFIIYGTFSSPGAFTLDIGKDWTNSGTYINGLETIRFDGGIAQSINGITSQTFSNITVAANSTLTHTLTAIILTGNLLFESGSFNTANVLILKSDANGTANIGDLTNGTFIGNVILERMVPAGATNWRFLSSGLTGQTISNWDDDFITSGFFGSNYPTFNFISIYSYNEAIAGIKDNGFVPAASVADNLVAGKGFWTWSGDNSAGTVAFTIDLIGAINQGNINLPVSYTNSGLVDDDGWNMVGNPYPSAIDWNSPNWTKTNVDDAIYIWDPNTAAYASYVGGVGNNGGSNIIASSQGFWVKTNAAGPVLTATEGVKSTSLTDPIKSFVPNQLIRMSVTPLDSSSRDETTISFNPFANESFESSVDAVKIKSVMSGVVQISTNSSDNKKLSINSLAIDGDIEIPIFIQVPDTGVYKFEIKDLGGLDAAACAHIKDEESNFWFSPINGDKTFYKNINATPEPFHKFTIIISANNTVDVTPPSCAQVNNGKVVVTNYGNAPWEYTLSSLSDTNMVLTTSPGSGTETISNLPSGNYSITVGNSSYCSNRTSEITILTADSTIALFNSDLAGIVLIDDYEFSFFNESSNADSFEWEFGDGGESSEVDPIHYYSTPGEYEVILTAFKDEVCQQKTTKKILVLDVLFDESEGSFSAHVFPNPVHQGDYVLLHFNKYIEDANIQIHNIHGKLVYNHFDYIKSTHTMLELENLAAGIYIIDILAGESTTSFKLIVE